MFIYKLRDFLKLVDIQRVKKMQKSIKRTQKIPSKELGKSKVKVKFIYIYIYIYIYNLS